MNRNLYQNGNVLFVVLAGTALFAALTVAVTRSSNTDGGAVMSQAEAKLHAASIIDFGNAVEQAVTRLVSIGGCDVTEVSFEKSPFDGSDTDYVNSNSPSDNSCHVFHPNGGQIEMITIEEKWLDDSYAPAGLHYGDIVVSVSCLIAVGNHPPSSTDCNTPSEALRAGEIILILSHIKEPICAEIVSKLMTVDTIPVQSNNAYKSGSLFVGDFAVNAAHITYTGAHTKLNEEGTKVGCFQDDANGAYPSPNSYSYYNSVYIQ